MFLITKCSKNRNTVCKRHAAICINVTDSHFVCALIKTMYTMHVKVAAHTSYLYEVATLTCLHVTMLYKALV